MQLLKFSDTNTNRNISFCVFANTNTNTYLTTSLQCSPIFAKVAQSLYIIDEK